MTLELYLSLVFDLYGPFVQAKHRSEQFPQMYPSDKEEIFQETNVQTTILPFSTHGFR